MQGKRRYSPTTVNVPGTAARFKGVSTSEITKTVPDVANQRQGDGDEFKRYKAQQQRDLAAAIETGAGEIKDVRSRPGRLLAPPFGLFLRAALLAHLKRTFR